MRNIINPQNETEYVTKADFDAGMLRVRELYREQNEDLRRKCEAAVTEAAYLRGIVAAFLPNGEFARKINEIHEKIVVADHEV